MKLQEGSKYQNVTIQIYKKH